ncbi:MAG: hypothetical protein HQ517_07250 [SAR324 cluster bacterium]|nr:hypothetical protein [SAR324 cluster bacterium]
METIKSVGVKALKDQLSLYLREVKAGCVVLITERGNVVAELHQPVRQLLQSEEESIKTQWISKGKLKLSNSVKRKCRPSPIKSKAGTAITLLNQERGE